MSGCGQFFLGRCECNLCKYVVILEPSGSSEDVLPQTIKRSPMDDEGREGPLTVQKGASCGRIEWKIGEMVAGIRRIP